MLRILTVIGLIMLMCGCLTSQAGLDSELVGVWASYDTYRIDKDDDTDDIIFQFFDDNKYHNKFYDNLKPMEGLILETKGTYVIVSGSVFEWKRTHKWNGSEWILSEGSGVFTFKVSENTLELSTDKYSWILTRM